MTSGKAIGPGKQGGLAINAGPSGANEFDNRTTTAQGPSPRLIEQPTPPNSAGSFPPYISPDQALLSDVRKPPTTRDSSIPSGFLYEGHTCYRNAVVIMLLCARPFMSYIQNRHKGNVEVARVVAGLCDERMFLSDNGSVPPEEYSNLLLELDRLYKVYWSSGIAGRQTVLEEAMAHFHNALLDARPYSWMDTFQQQFPATDSKGRPLEHDAGEFLLWLLQRASSQLQVCSQLVAYVPDFQSVSTLQQTLRLRCRKCWQVSMEKHRSSALTSMDLWTVNLEVVDTRGKSAPKDSFRLEELLGQTLKQPGDHWYCDVCQSEWKARQATLPAEAVEAETARRDRENLDWQWRRFISLPEVLFMNLVRFQRRDKVTRKDLRHVEVPQEIDLAGFLEHDMPDGDRHPGRYQLRSLVLHAGSTKKGHYINYIKGDNDQWWEVDGADTSPIAFEGINDTKPWRSNAFTPYILCWERIVDNEQAPKTNTDLPAPAKQNLAATQNTNSSALKASTIAEIPSSQPQKIADHASIAINTTKAPPLQSQKTTIGTKAAKAMTVSNNEPCKSCGQRKAEISKHTKPSALPSLKLKISQARLHIDLILGSKSFFTEHILDDFDFGLFDAILNDQKPAAEWKATIELPAATKTMQTTPKANVGDDAKGKNEVQENRFIHLEPAITRTHFLLGDLHSTLKRSVRLITKRQQAGKPLTAPPPPLRTGQGMKRKPCDHPCSIHCSPSDIYPPTKRPKSTTSTARTTSAPKSKVKGRTKFKSKSKSTKNAITTSTFPGLKHYLQ